jgi:hypothetical protein
MKYGAMPLFMTDGFFRESDAGYGPVGDSTNYISKPSMEVEGDTPEAACEQVWSTYQNIDENRKTPDGGRSMMVGDLVLLQGQGSNDVRLYRAASVGFEPARFPNTTVGAHDVPAA